MIFKGEELDLILTYDGITCYIKVDDEYVITQFEAAMNDCQSLATSSSQTSVSESSSFASEDSMELDTEAAEENSQYSSIEVESESQDGTLSIELDSEAQEYSQNSFQELVNSLREGMHLVGHDLVATQTLDYERDVHNDDDIHELYHQDNHNREGIHFHLKFKTFLDAGKVSEVLAILVTHHLLHPDEHIEFIQAWQQRYDSMLIQKYKPLCGGDKDLDAYVLTQYIKECRDNDLLFYLHVNLLLEKYNYLRQLTPLGDDGLWRGMINAEGELAITSYVWAMIEKAISLQMGHNVVANCKFTPEVAAEKYQQFSSKHPFFALKRKTNGTNGHTTNRAAQAFAQGHGDTFERYYNFYFAIDPSEQHPNLDESECERRVKYC